MQKLIHWLHQKLSISTQGTSQKPQTVDSQHHRINQDTIHPNALTVLSTLHRNGYQSYLVGGCVRDLLLNHVPKDFDVVTDALPDTVKKQFSRCLIIGRRFRLAHVYFGREVIEVATFRGNQSTAPAHKSATGMILRDNSYGDISEDAYRRDFTINALYYNFSNNTLVDYTGGLNDIHARRIKLIGDPSTRYREDPVRMLRAIRFAAKLNFTIDPDTASPIHELKPLLKQVSPARLLEEWIKLCHCGSAERALELLLNYDILGILSPQLVANPNYGSAIQLFSLALRNTDRRLKDRKTVMPAFSLAALLWYPKQTRLQEYQASNHLELPLSVLNRRAQTDVLTHQHQITTIPRHMATTIQEIWDLQHRFHYQRLKRANRLLEQSRFRAAFDFLELRSQLDPTLKPLVEWWEAFQIANNEEKKHLCQSFDVEATQNTSNRTAKQRQSLDAR